MINLFIFTFSVLSKEFLEDNYIIDTVVLLVMIHITDRVSILSTKGIA